MEFLERVTQHSENNKMDLTNVAMVIAPSLFVALPVRNTLDDVTMAAKTSHVVRLLIKYHPLLWTVGLLYTCTLARFADQDRSSTNSYTTFVSQS